MQSKQGGRPSRLCLDLRPVNQAIDHICHVDSAMAVAIKRVGAYRLERQQFDSVFEALSRSIVFQQLSGKAAGTIYGRLVAAFGDGNRPLPSKVHQAQVEQLRAVGLSRPKAGYIKGLAGDHLAGQLPALADLEKMDDATIIESLTAARGVGTWTVQMLLIFWLGRHDVLPVDDLAIRKGLQITLGLDQPLSPVQVAAHGQCWAPWRSVASWYLWRVCHL
jgi:DNA-3-methyladenine glycosylase II